MSSKVVALLEQYGPMLSGELARIFEIEYKVSNEAARQALSRAKAPVHKLQTISFEKNQKFFYLENQFLTQQYMRELLQAIKTSSQVYWIYICAFKAQKGYVAKNLLPALVSSPIQKVKGHKLHKQVVNDLLKCQIIEEYNDIYWKLNDQILSVSQNFASAVGLEAVKKQVVNDFAKWARNINLIGYDSAKTLPASAEFAQFQWALTAPSYIQPMYDFKHQRPGFVVADIFYGQIADVEDVLFFLKKLSVIRTFEKLAPVFPVLLAESVTNEALKELKAHKVTIALIKNIFDDRYTELLAEIVHVFTYSSAIIAKNPEKIEVLFREISKSEGRYNDIIGDMFELLVGYYYQQLGCRYLEIRKMIQIPGSTKTNEIDVLVIRDGQVIIVECKATHSAVDTDFVEKWLSKNIEQIRDWFLAKYNDGTELTFQLWSLGGFTPEALEKLNEAAAKTKKYKIEFFDRKQMLEMAREHKVQLVADILHQKF